MDTQSFDQVQPDVETKLHHTWWMWLCLMGIALWMAWMADVYPVNNMLAGWTFINLLLWLVTGLTLHMIREAGYKFKDQTKRVLVARDLMVILTASSALYYIAASVTSPQQATSPFIPAAPIPTLPTEVALPPEPTIEFVTPTTRPPLPSSDAEETTFTVTTTPEPTPTSTPEPTPTPEPTVPDPVQQDPQEPAEPEPEPEPEPSPDPTEDFEPPVAEDPSNSGVVVPPGE